MVEVYYFPVRSIYQKGMTLIERSWPAPAPHCPSQIPHGLHLLCCSMYCLCVNVYCHRVTTQLQLTNISHHNTEHNVTHHVCAVVQQRSKPGRLLEGCTIRHFLPCHSVQTDSHFHLACSIQQYFYTVTTFNWNYNVCHYEHTCRVACNTA